MKRLVSLKKSDGNSQERDLEDEQKSSFRVNFELGAPLTNNDDSSALLCPPKRPTLHRTKSRSVECLKTLEESRNLLRKNVLKSHCINKTAEEIHVSGSESSFGSRSGQGSRSQSYYTFRSGPNFQKSPGVLQENFSAGNLLGRYPPSYASFRGGLMNDYRCGSTPPRSVRNNSLTGGGNSINYGSMNPLLQILPSNPRSEENLLVNLHREQEKSWLNISRIREETNVIQNIKKRELVELKKKEININNNKPAIRQNKKLFPTIPLNLIPSNKVWSNNKSKSVVSGLLGTKTILLAPTAATLIDPSVIQQSTHLSHHQQKMLEMERLNEWIPPPIQKPAERPIVRKFLTCFLNKKETPVGTKFTESDFVQNCLQYHNTFREMHNIPPLEINEQLCASAQYWANILAHRDELCHENLENEGENMFAWPLPPTSRSYTARKCPDVTGHQVAAYWYKFSKEYHYDKNPEILHAFSSQFTQLIWAESKLFGCGKGRSRSGKVIVVARYYPKGNIPGLFHRNVFPPKDQLNVKNLDGIENKEDLCTSPDVTGVSF